MSQVEFCAAGELDPTVLAEIRAIAMEPSLTAIGRFDPQRVRDRFLSGYVAEDTRLVRQNGQIAGFFVLRDRGDHLYLDHIYVKPEYQGFGLGQQVVAWVKQQATMRGLPVRLMALKDSPANRFYLSCGFEPDGEEQYDNLYVWIP